MIESFSNKFQHRRIVSIDYGMKRIGIAVCDGLHITVTPLSVIDRSKENYLNEITRIITSENAGAIIVGVPIRLDGKETDVILEIREFIKDLKSRIEIDVLEFDESYSTVRATETMLSIGKKKKKRAGKGEKDKIAAAIILREFLEEIR